MSYEIKDYYISEIQKQNCDEIIKRTNALYNIDINLLSEDEMKDIRLSQGYDLPINSKFEKEINNCEKGYYSDLLNTYAQLFNLTIGRSISLRRLYRIDYVIKQSYQKIEELTINLNQIITQYSLANINYDKLNPANKLAYKILYKNIRDILSYNNESLDPTSNITEEYLDAIDYYNSTRKYVLKKINSLIGKFNNNVIEAEKIKGGSSHRKSHRKKSRSRSRGKKSRSKSKRKNKSKK